MAKEKYDYFDNLMLQSVKYQRHLNENKKNYLYYEDGYANNIKAYFEEKGIDSFETLYNAKNKVTPICAFASSGRLCYLDFRARQERGEIASLSFEVPLDNDNTESNRPTKIDAADLDKSIYYECKLQEIRGTSKDFLSVTYRDHSELFKSFGIKNIGTKTYTDKEGKKRIGLTFPVSELGIQLEGDPDYNKLHFDLKQLICHLIALANIPGKEKKTLQYVLYMPDDEAISRNPRAKRLYEKLDKEVEAIFAPGTKLQSFCERESNNIVLARQIERIPISSVRDFNYEETYLD